MNLLLQYFRLAVKLLLKNPASSIARVVTMAIGIGANVAIFSVFHAVLLQRLPYPNSDRLVVIREQRLGAEPNGVSYPNYLDWCEMQHSFKELAFYRQEGLNFSTEGQVEPQRVAAVRASANFLSLLGLRPQLGRDISETEDRTGAPHVALISKRIWQDRFGGKAEAIGQRIMLQEVSYQIIGIMPEMELGGSDSVQILIPLAELRGDAQFLQRGNRAAFVVIGRLKDGVTLKHATAEFAVISQNLEQRYSANVGRRIDLRSLLDSMVGEYRNELYFLLGAGVGVLLIACANIAGLLLASGAARQREFAIRFALGANRFQVALQLVVENCVLAILGAGAGLAVTFFTLDAIIALGPSDEIRFREAHLNGPALLFTGSIAVFAVILAGTWPATLSVFGAGPAQALRGASRAIRDVAARYHTRATLVVAQIAATLILLIGTGLLTRSFWLLQHVDLGFDPHRLLLMSVSLPSSRYVTEQSKSNFSKDVLERIRLLPAVAGAATGFNLPFDDVDWTSTFHVTGQSMEPPGHAPRARIAAVSPDYFRVMGIRLIRGRYFGPEDAARPAWSLIIDERFVRRFFAGEDPIGKHVDNHFLGLGQLPPLTVVGVVSQITNDASDAVHNEMLLPQMYLALNQRPQEIQTLVVRVATGDPLSLAGEVKRAVLAVNPNQPVYNVSTMDKVISESFSDRRVSVWLTAVFSGIALCLAAVGVFAMMALRVTQATRDIGIRLALGAQRADIFRHIIQTGLRLTAVGIVIGIAGGVVLARLVRGLLFGIQMYDAPTYIIAVLLVVAVSICASYIPAARAMRIEPIRALREE